MGMRTSQRNILCGLVVVAALAGSPTTAAEVLWRIGTFDESPGEFNQGKPGPPLFGSPYPQGQLLYTIGKSTPAVDWPAYQEGSTIGKPGSHPYRVKFNFEDVPYGVFTLKVGLLSKTARIAELQVEINSHRGLFYQHPRLSYAGGDPELASLPIASAALITFDVPTSFLQKGFNTLTLTPVDEPTAGAQETHSGITYDALELDHDFSRKFAGEEVAAQAEPTIFYVRQGAGLAELVDVFVRHSAPVLHGHVTLTVGGRIFTQELAAREFGEQKVVFAVPELPGTVEGSIEVVLDGRARHFPATFTPAKKWNLLIVPHIHVDVGYSDYQEKVAEIQSRVLDEAIDLIRQYPAFRFSPDGYWSVREYLAGRSEEQQKQFVQMVKENKIFVPTVEASLLTGFPGLETLIRSLYPAFAFNQKHGGAADYADITDVPSYSWSYASVMAAAGLKYFIAGSHNDNGPILLYSRLNENSPFWWEGPDGSKILMWYGWLYSQLAVLFGGMDVEMAVGRDSLPIFLQAYSHPEYKSDSVLIYGTQWENTDLFPRQASLADDWNRLYAYPHLEYSGFADALRAIVSQFGDAIPVLRGDGGPYWEYGIASTARSAGIEREAEHRALTAEEFSTVSSLVNPRVRVESEVLKRLWNNMVLYDEHTWGAYSSVSDPESRQTVNQLAAKEAFATDAMRDIEYVLRRSLAALADSIYDPQGTLLVFNPLSWQRSGLVEMDLDKGQELVDLATNRTVSFETLSSGKSYRAIRFLAQGVPPVGYKAYRLKPANEEPRAAPVVGAASIENQYYRVTLDPDSGAIRSIFDKDLNRELVNTSSPYRFDQYLYVTGGDQSPNRLLQFSSNWPIPELTIHKAGGGRLVSVTDEPFGVVARLESSDLNTPKIETEIILSSGHKKIGLINHVTKSPVHSKEGVYFAFPFAMDQPQFRYEIQNGFVDPEHDQLPGAGKEVFSVQHWVSAQEGGVTAALIPVDAPLVTLGDIMRGTWPKDFGRRSGTIFSQIMNNYFFTNYAAGQGGDFTFRYAVTSGRDLMPGYLSRLGREEMSPLETDQITPQDKALNEPRPLGPNEGSFLQVNPPDMVLVTWKLAEDGNGSILRFLEVAGKPADVKVDTPLLELKGAWRADALERNQEALSTSSHGFRFPAQPFQIVTVRIEGAPVGEK